MKDLRIIRQVSMCYKKSRYVTEQRAQQFINKIKTERQVNFLRSYYCPVCTGFHLTSKPLRG